jgi:hypothetical protein
MKRSLIAVAALALLAPGSVGAAGLAAGAYEEALLIGYDPAAGVVSGYFDMTQGEAPSFSCIFYLKGKLVGREAKVDTYFPQDPGGDLIKGTLTLEAGGKLRLTLPQEHGGCGNVWHFADPDQPAEFDLAAAHPWTSVRVVKAAKAFFYPAAGAPAHGRAYIVQGDGVGVTAAKPGWVQADYVGGTKPIAGWLKVDDLYPGP